MTSEATRLRSDRDAPRRGAVVFDLLGAQNREHSDRGIARYVAAIALALEEVAPGFVDRYLIRPDLPIPGRLAPLLGTGRVELHDDSRTWPIGETGTFLSGSLFEMQYAQERIIPARYQGPNWSRAAVLYDLIPLRFDEHYLVDGIERAKFRARTQMLATMDDVFPISQATADDAVELAGLPANRLTVIHAGADARFRPNPGGHEVAVAEVHADPPVPGLRARYLLNTSGIEWRKNNERLLEAFARLPHPLREKHQLVIVCSITDEQRAEMAQLTDRLGITPDVLFTGFVSDEALVRLYQAAHLVVFPTLYEGFGLPVLEARRCGAPAICSDSSSLREVLTDPDMRFDPLDVDSIANTMYRYTTEDDARAAAFELPVPEYSWQLGARRIVEALGARTEKRSHVRRPRPRVALLTPVPPMRSGIAYYAAKMLDRLAAEVDLTVFADADAAEIAAIPGIEVYPTNRFEEVEKGQLAFDRIVTFLGNSRFHVDALDVVLRHGGVVVLHDVRLTGLYAEVAKAHPRRLVDGSVGHTLHSLYPSRYKASIEAMDLIDPGTAADYGVQMLKGVVDAADSVLVHSEYAATVAELDTGVRPEVLFGLPFDPPAGTPAPEPGHLVTLGVLSPAKLPEVLLDAVRILRAERDDVTLAFVGDGPDDAYVDYLRTAAAERGIGDAVEVTGFLAPDAYGAEIRRASLALQLRAFTNGESSAAVQDALAAGIPTVVNDLGAMGEYADDVVVKVEPGVGPERLAAVIGELLDDEERRTAMSAAALDLAAAHSYEAAAEALLAHLDL